MTKHATLSVDADAVSRAVEKVIRPIVEGQIKGFLKEHPPIVNAVDWFKPRKDKETTLINSLSKRIVRDLTCGRTTARLVDALLELSAEALPNSTVAPGYCGEGGQLGTHPDLAALRDAIEAGTYRPDHFELARFAEAA